MMQACSTLSRKSRRQIVVTCSLLCCVFFSWGFLTALNSILIPYLQQVFALSYTQSMYIQVIFSASPLLVSLPAANLINSIGYKKALLAGLLLVAMGALLFIPATESVSFGFILFAVAILASGVGAIQVVANPYIAHVGESSKTASRLSMAQGVNSLGTTIAPYLGSVLLFSATATEPGAQIRLVQLPYVGVAVALLLLCVIIFFSEMAEPKHEASKTAVSANSLWQYRQLMFGVVAIFCYTGAETSIAAFLVSYLRNPAIANVDVELAGKLVALYWAGAMIGRLSGSALFLRYNARILLIGCAVTALFFLGIAMIELSYLGAIALIMIGLCHSIMYPVIFSLAVFGVEDKAAASGVLVMAGVGGAVLPLIQAIVADNFGLASSLFVPAVSYVYILFYSLKGWQPSSTVCEANS
ncbi:MFS transporter [Vibrio aestuarianus]|uniref:MFS transporter n=1 Tax=Vibrio aestuarianus TaxID=28171 RepID=A0AAX3U3I9_9VIBR|nr:MFS transporter [Vibrio aestuarianus]MDE1238194.1 MFS transporter [Vibrio aestuarianus]WGK81993.1 MFS transporter [Vibrio aestuarianus]